MDKKAVNEALCLFLALNNKDMDADDTIKEVAEMLPSYLSLVKPTSTNRKNSLNQLRESKFKVLQRHLRTSSSSSKVPEICENTSPDFTLTTVVLLDRCGDDSSIGDKIAPKTVAVDILGMSDKPLTETTSSENVEHAHETPGDGSKDGSMNESEHVNEKSGSSEEFEHVQQNPEDGYSKKLEHSQEPDVGSLHPENEAQVCRPTDCL